MQNPHHSKSKSGFRGWGLAGGGGVVVGVALTGDGVGLWLALLQRILSVSDGVLASSLFFLLIF